MNTHDIDIELPPLPEARIVSYQTDSTMRRMELRTYSDKDMKDYARAAIEADRKRRGEPVARVCYPNRDADAKLIAAAPGLLAAARAALHYMRLHKYADQAWADDLEAAIAAAMTPNT